MTEKVERGGRTFPRPSFPVEGAGKTACVTFRRSVHKQRKERSHQRHHDQSGILQWRSVGVKIDREDQDE